MLLKLENIGMISKAEIKLDGLTVIAGWNDSGKTTIGKMFYVQTKFLEYISSEIENKQKEMDFTFKAVFGLELKKFVKKEYYLGIFNNEYYISKKNDKVILNKPNKIYPFKFNVCFIDTPDILTKSKYIKNANFLMSQNNLKFFIPHQVSDLILRLSQDIIENKNNEIYKKISEIIHGEVYYDGDRDDFYFKKDNLDEEINIHNTSNGIKMFGLLQVLIGNETIKENSILILDEPEVHLHPKWQLKYAEILVELVKSGVIVLVTSHSPYIVEALKVYSDKENLADKTNFYLAESEDGESSTITDITNNLEPIFEKLSEPFDRLEKEEIDNFKW